MKRIVIIGGGITGLAAAHRILERSAETGTQVELRLLEAGNRLGGIVQTHERDGFLIESGPDSFISEKPAAWELAQRLGLGSHLIETNKKHRRSFVVRRGWLRPLPQGFHLIAPAQFGSFFRSDILSWHGKARVALDLVLPRGNKNKTGDESLADFVRRRLGREALERIAQPMIGGIYTADPERLSLRATMPRFLEMEREQRSLIRALRKQNKSATPGSAAGQPGWVREGFAGSQDTGGARYSLFLSFDRGMQLLTDKLAERISDFKSQIVGEGVPLASAVSLNTAVESVALAREAAASQWRITTSRKQTLTADAICLALPAYMSAQLLRGVDQLLADELDGIFYASSATLNLAYNRADIPHPLDGFGFVVPFIENKTIIACTFSSVKFAGRAPQGYALLRVFIGGALQPKVLELTEAELLGRVRRDLRDLLGIEAAPLFTELTRWNRSMPQYHLGHLDRVQRIRERLASLPGLTLAGNAYSGPGLPDCIRNGEDAADSFSPS